MAEEWHTNEPPRDRQAERCAAYAAEFGGIEKKHKHDYRNTQYASIVGQVGCGVAIGLWWHPFETKPCFAMKSSLAFERYAVSAHTVEAVLVLSRSPSLNRAPSLATASVVFHLRIRRSFRSMETCDL